MSSKPVIIDACRTPGGKFGGAFVKTPAPQLGALVIAELLRRNSLPLGGEELGEVIMGNGWQAGVGANPARIASVKGGVPVSVPAFTVNKRCGSGLRAIMAVSDRIRLGDMAVGIGGGMENASLAPYIAPGARWGYRMGEKTVQDVLHADGLFCPLAEMMMGATGEILAEEYGISREEQDTFALGSHRKAVAAQKAGAFDREILPVTLKDRKKGQYAVSADEIPREDTSLEKLGRLPAIFKEEGTITAASSSALCDAGAAVLVGDAAWARAQGYSPMAEILGYSPGALAPDHMGLGPVKAVPKALEKAGLSLEDVDLIELNEAFAVQVLAVQRELGFPLEKCNIYGGAIALGHPIGATGAKILTTLLYALQREDKEIGLATACIGGGQGVAMVVRRLS